MTFSQYLEGGICKMALIFVQYVQKLTNIINRMDGISSFDIMSKTSVLCYKDVY